MAILGRLRSIPPQYANQGTVADYHEAVELLADDPGSCAWFEAVIQLGSHLLESPDGDHGVNVSMARHCYRSAMQVAEGLGDEADWLVAASGYANSLASDPAAGSAELREAINLFRRLESAYRAAGVEEPLAVTLGQAAAAYGRLPDGDLHANVDQAIRLQEDAVLLLAEAGPELASRRGRARHNLGVLYDRRKTGLRSQNLDRAVRSLQAALEDRPPDSDPIGRARTLRALASLYPEWVDTDLPQDATDLAEAAATEARLLEQDDPDARARTTGWAYLEREQSALNVDLDYFYAVPDGDRERATASFNSAIADHMQALEVLPRESMPFRWAEWSAGLGRLLGIASNPDTGEHVDQVHQCFVEALAAFRTADRPLLGRQIQARWGEYSHGIGDFARSMTAYRAALDLSDLVLASTVDPAHRLMEIAESRGSGLLAAFAAARLGLTGDAVVLAERERVRLYSPLLQARDALRRPDAPRERILAAVDRLRGLEQQLKALDEQDPDAQQEAMAARLADHLRLDPSMIKMRRVDDAADEPNPYAEERTRVRQALAEEHTLLQQLVSPQATGDAPHIDAAEEIAAVAQERGVALVYLMTTLHGSAALVVLPDGELDQVLLDDVDSNLTRALVHGSDEITGFLEATSEDDPAAMVDCLEDVQELLQPALFAQLTPVLQARGVERSVLIPLGSLGLLPLHVAAGDFAYSYAPSAGVLRAVASHAPRTSGMLALADPGHEDTEALPLSVAEARTISTMSEPEDRAVMLVGSEVTSARVRRWAAESRWVHFGCHGQFRPSEPLASELQLAGEEKVTVADVFSGDVDLSGAELVTLLACHSASGEFRRTPDECLSFPAAMLIGGAAAVVSTMWPVDDAAAAFFSVKFYELVQRDHVAPAEAVVGARAWLRSATSQELGEVVERMRAQLAPADDEAAAALDELASGLTHSAEQHPYGDLDLWAPFVLTGC